MDEIQTLRQELTDLKREVASLRRTRWITPSSMAIALISLVALGVAAPRQAQQQTPPPSEHTPTQLAQDLKCRSVEIVDAAGHQMALLGSDKDGGFFVMNGADSKKRFFTAVENNSGFSDWYDATGARRATVFVGDKGAEFHLADGQEHTTAVLQQSPTGGFLALGGPDGNNRVATGVDNGGGYLDLSDSLGNLRESFYLSDKNTAQFKMLGADKVMRFLVSGNPDFGQVVSYDQAGKQKAIFP